MRFLITGSSGLIGSALISSLNQNDEYSIYKLVRKEKGLLPDEIYWNPEKGDISPSIASSLEGFDVVIHLAGENIMGRWSDSKKKRIKESRIKGTLLLSQTLSQLKKPPSLFIGSSGITYYGDRGNEILTEDSEKGEGFLANVCEEWEEAARPIAEVGTRVAHLRIGMVLSLEGGALPKMLPLFRMGLGGKIGDGSQYISWITIDDLVSIFQYVINNESLAGPINAISPFPVTNREFAKILGKVLNRPTIFTVPTFMINLLFGQMGKEVLISSVRAEPKKLERKGFHFETPQLESAFQKLLK